jgi:predicted ATP-grasp superfamily ATP-dependent carboligase
MDGSSPLALVFGGSVNGLSFVRSLGRRGVPTLMLDSERLIGTYTRFGDVVLLPPPAEQPEAWVEFLDFVKLNVRDGPVLFPTSDPHMVFLADQAGELSRGFRFLVPSLDKIERIVCKRSQYAVAEQAGIPIPRTHFPDSLDELRSVADRLTYPCILKPYRSHIGVKKLGKKVVVVATKAELEAEFSRISTDGVQLMVQEIIPGGDDALYGYLAFWDAEAKECAWLTKRKLRQCPPLYGDGSLQVTVDAPEVADLSRRLLRAYDYVGFVGVEFKYNAADGIYRLMEINPRTVSGNQLAISAGIDFPWIGYEYLLAGNSSCLRPATFRRNVKYVNEEWDLKAYLALRRAGNLTLREWLRSVWGASARAIGAWDDPLPLLNVMGRIVRASLREAWKRLPGRASGVSQANGRG